ncbi:MAG TPA: ABC transporter permease [Candidatus Anoxymicrobiaceae bacterium]|jgi:putative ABC transport system permease protein
MAKYILRNMWRRKARTFLTIFGIVVGILALTVLGGLSARLNQQVQGAKSWFTSSISVVPSGGSLFGGGQDRFFNVSKVSEVEAVPGVKSASAAIGVLLSESQSFSFGAPDLLIGLSLDGSTELLNKLALSEGRYLKPGDRDKVVLGSALAEKNNATVGGTVDLRGKTFEVVGILKATLSAPDNFAFVPYDDALPVFLQVNPFFQQNTRIASVIYAIWDPGANPEVVGARIARQVKGVKVITPAEAQKQISQFSLIFNAILFGIAFIALVVGGLSIINTMVMSVSERTREIGLKKAIGAGTNSILLEYLLESATIGLIGGLLGTGIGLVIIELLNSATATKQIRVFTITTLVVIGPIVFATVLGTLAGVFPALRAARLRPVESLKEE